jgi:hypothetical protein
MMNIVELQDTLKNFSQDQLVREMQSPTGNAPQYLVLGEIMRRQKMQQDFSTQQAKGDQGTVAQDAVAAAGVPQGGIADMARALAPSTDMAQNAGIQTMYAGGPVKKMQAGGKAETDPAVIAMANRAGMTVREYLAAIGEEEATRVEMGARTRAERDRMMALEPIGDGITMPSQADLARRFQEERLGFLASRPMTPPAADMPPMMPSAAEGAPTSLGAPPLLAPVTAYMPPRMRAEPSAAQRAAMQGAQPAMAPPDAGVRPPPPEQVPTEFAEQFGMESYDPDVPVAGFAERVFGAPALERIGVETTRTAALPGQTTGPGIEIPEGGIDELLPPEQAVAPAASPGGGGGGVAVGGAGGGGAGGGGVGGGGAGGAGGGAASSYEQALMDALASREKAAEQDKWLALAQVGLNLMSSTQPTIGGAIGEAGLAGVEAMRSARDTYDKDKLELMGALEQSRAARAKMAMASARGGGGGGGGGLSSISAGQGRLLTQINTDIERLDTALNNPMMMGATLTPEQEMQLAAAARERDMLVAYRQQLLYGAPLAAASADDTYGDVADE